MALKLSGKKLTPALNVDSAAAMIARLQKDSGEIPWHENGKTDPWDHVESIMGLNTAGYHEEARKAFQWLTQMQLEDGSLYASYENGKPSDMTRDTNMSSYVAVGAYHHYLITGDLDFLSGLFETIKRGIDFAISMQAKGGEIYWAKSPSGKTDPMALLTGSSSIFMSIKCALAIAKEIGISMPAWQIALEKLGNAIRNNTHTFNISKSRYSMYWFYPILAGAITGDEAKKRVTKYWNKYIIEEQGVRCVSDQPWVTIAETAEFVIALCAMNNREQAEIVFNWICERKYDDGTYWCGFTFPDMVIWPEDQLSWTNAVVLMAADALYGMTPAQNLFTHKSWDIMGIGGKTS